MTKFELLKQKVAEVCSNEANRQHIFDADDWLFIVKEDRICVIDGSDLCVFTPDYSEEDMKEACRIIYNMSDKGYSFLHKGVLSGSIYNLDSLIDDFCEDDDIEPEVEKDIEELIELLTKEDCRFYGRDADFFYLHMHEGLESGIAYVHSDWDHDEAYYNGWSFHTGVDDPLYDVIEEEPSLVIPDDLKNEDEDCDFWIDVLSNLDQYIWEKNQKLN